MSDNDSPAPPPTHSFCSKCKRVLEISAFRRYLTTAEAKAHGYSGERRVQIETKHCKDCRPRRRVKPEAFKTYELKEKLKRGEVPAPLVAAIEKTRTAKARVRMRAAVVARWDKVKMAQYKELLGEVQAEVRTVTHQRKHARNRTKNEAVAQAIVHYADTYLEILRRLRADLIIAGRRLAFKVEHETWQGYLTKAERDAIAMAWTAIEPNKAATMRPPAAFAIDRFTQPVVPIIHPPSTPTQGNDQPIETTQPQEDQRPATNWDDL